MHEESKDLIRVLSVMSIAAGVMGRDILQTVRSLYCNSVGLLGGICILVIFLASIV